MQKRGTWLRAGLTGAAAGAVNGLFGAGGGMLLLPLLHRLTDLREHEAFACSVCTMLPLSVVSLVVYWLRGGEFLTAALPYLAGGALGGIAAGLLLRRLSAVWLHRALGALIVWGGLLSGLGIGGGTLLMVWMTGVAALPQQTAQGINLLYFLPSAACALFFHIRNRLIRWDIVLPAALGGCVTAAIAAWIATGLDVSLLRRLFGGFLLLTGLRELFFRQQRDKNAR